MRNRELLEKWAAVLDHEKMPEIDPKRRDSIAVILENTEKSIENGEQYIPRGLLNEAEVGPVNNVSQVANFDPVLIKLVRRTVPNLIAYDIAGVQPMTGPTGLIFAMRSNYVDGTNNEVKTEAFYNEVDTDFSGTGTHAGTLGQANTDAITTGTGMSTNSAEELGSAGGGAYGEMSIELEKMSVEAKSRALKAEYTTEMAQDLKAIHGLDAEAELANMLSTQLVADINREVVRTVYRTAVPGATDMATAGVFDLDVDSNGRWMGEKFKGLMFQIEREAGAISRETRMGRGNLIICSSDVASALQMAGILDHTPALQGNNRLAVDDTGNTFAGILNGRYRVYIDPYASGNYCVVGYKGANQWDAGLFYCPYVPLQMVRAVGENSFQSKIGFKTRYGLVAHPYAQGATKGSGALTVNTNKYYRRMAVSNIM